MNFCANCGTKKNIDAKFCPNCGQSVMSEQAQPPAPALAKSVESQPTPKTMTQASTPTKPAASGTAQKELLQLSNAYFSMYAVSLLLMKLQAEGGFKTTLSDLGDDVGIALAVMFVVIGAAVALLYFTVRVQGINRGKPGWVLGTLIVIGAGTLFSWTDANFSNFNWADWLAEAIGLGQLYVLFAIYQLLKAAKSVQD
ncbi:MAG: zinc ribbon domain-containing protein [Candidatus Methylopumilus sp.]|nr:zinc ribbon domain-containing protein [Candidatus Methylopumilus sp.]